MSIICKSCKSTDIKIEIVSGRGLPPKGYVERPNRRISWAGKWEVGKCNNCGKEWKFLIK